jgi:ATP/maltotriose-dependent transcriptional regulator MalT
MEALPRMPRRTKKQRVLDLIASCGWRLVGEPEWHQLKAALPDISDVTIRNAGSVQIAQPWRGVLQHSLDDLEASLRELSEVYTARPDLRPYCREQVIAAKARARFASRSAKVEDGKRHLKAEMVEWMLVWLADPAMFPTWAALRRKAVSNR